MSNNRSPLTAKPLRVAGQSLDEAMQKLWDDDVLEAFVIAIVGVTLAGYEWARWWFSSPPQPVLISLCAFVLVCWATWRVMHGRRVMRQLRQGRDGERAVAELLERMREEGFRVFHDISGPNFNVDHLLVGPQGLYVIETKTISKPTNRDATIKYDGVTVTVGGFKPDRDPVRQVTAIANWIRDLVKESTGRVVPVRPVVLYPGWFVEPAKNKEAPVWVLSPRALPSLVANEPTPLQAEDVNMVAFHLSRYVRTSKEP
jgi:hypothetical protein